MSDPKWHLIVLVSIQYGNVLTEFQSGIWDYHILTIRQEFHRASVLLSYQFVLGEL